MKYLFATQNSHKLAEIQAILKGYQVISLDSLNDDEEVEETGSTFFENAFLKANRFFQKYHLPTFADDSGLVVPALNGAPGIYSARYSGENVDYAKNNRLLLKNMEGQSNRQAYFVSVVCFIAKNGEAHYFEGRLNGFISQELRGNQGFGYDPLFWLPELKKTVGELSETEKNQISHRSIAFRKLIEFLKAQNQC
jgi:XTP/dITP diphosphohydrolase